MDIEKQHSSLLSIQSMPATKRQLGQINQEHSSWAYDNETLSRMGYSPGDVVVPSGTYDRPNVSGVPSTDGQHVPNTEYYMKHDPYPALEVSAKDNNDGGSLTKLDHAEYASATSRSQLGSEEDVRLANAFNTRATASNIAADLVQIDDQSNNEPSYQLIRILGHGGSASVEEVLDLNTGSVFARKVIRNVYSRNIDEAKRKLLNEVRIMQRLASHHHIVSVHAAYVRKRELTMILDPVADGGDLAGYLQNYRDQGFHHISEEMTKENLYQNLVLRRAFGCLASALDFIHGQTIRHKDIKPQNILIHQGHIMYTDFGLSYDYGDIGQSTTTGNPQGITRRYCAPEVVAWERRNTKSDVFSLGCVFIEIFLALANDAHYDKIYERTFHEVVQSYNDTDIPLPIFEGQDGWRLSNVIQKMIRSDPKIRPSACTVADASFRTFSISGNNCSRCDVAFKAEQTEREQAMSDIIAGYS